MANITINDTPTRVQYTASGGQTVFSYTFPIKEDTDLKVYLYDNDAQPDDDTQLLVLTTDYTVTGANTAAGGTVVLVVAAAANDIVTILGDKPIDRLAIYDQSVTLSKADLNNDFNDNVMYEKQIETILNQITPKYERDELVGNGVRPDKLRLPMLNDGEVWVGRGELGDDPDDIVAVDLGSLIDLDAEFVLGTANLDFPDAQVLGGLGEGIVYNDDDGVTGTLTILNIGGGLTLNTSTQTLSVTGTGFNIAWYTVTVNTQMVTNSGYIPNSGGTLTLTLPVTASVGDVTMVVGRGAGGWIIAQAAGQQIHFGNVSTTAGAGGSLSSTDRRDTFTLICTVANLEWTAQPPQGNITYV